VLRVSIFALTVFAIVLSNLNTFVLIKSLMLLFFILFCIVIVLIIF
jgi:hypothetical protein